MASSIFNVQRSKPSDPVRHPADFFPALQNSDIKEDVVGERVAEQAELSREDAIARFRARREASK